MKGIKTLIKLQKKELDDRAKKKAAHQAQIDQLRKKIEALQTALAQEEQLISHMPDMAFMFMAYADTNKQQQQQLQNTILHIEKQVQALEEQMQVYFSELKKYEIALERRIKKQTYDEKLKDEKFLNDIAANSFIRKMDESS